MEKNSNMQQPNPVRTIRVLARISSVPIILLTLVVVFAHIPFPDTNQVSYPPIQNLLPVLMTVSVLGLAIAWWREGIGGAVTLVFFIAHLLAYWEIRGKFSPRISPSFSPVFVTGVLFLWCSFEKQQLDY